MLPLNGIPSAPRAAAIIIDNDLPRPSLRAIA